MKKSKLNTVGKGFLAGWKSEAESNVSFDTHIPGLGDFNEHDDLFQTLTKRYQLSTGVMDIMEMAISYDSKQAIAICKESESVFQVNGYSLLNFELLWENKFEDMEFVRMNFIEQNLAGEIFAIAYQDDGVFRVRVIDNKGETLDDLAVTDEINGNRKENGLEAMDSGSKPIEGQNEPLITCCFIAEDDMFISVYHRKDKQQHHFTYSYILQKRTSEITVTDLGESTLRNFPIKSFYSLVTKNCHTFYRQGQGVTAVATEPENSWDEKLTDKDMGSMYFIFD